MSGTTDQNLFKSIQESLAAWKQSIKNWRTTQDFYFLFHFVCTTWLLLYTPCFLHCKSESECNNLLIFSWTCEQNETIIKRSIHSQQCKQQYSIFCPSEVGKKVKIMTNHVRKVKTQLPGEIQENPKFAFPLSISSPVKSLSENTLRVSVAHQATHTYWSVHRSQDMTTVSCTKTTNYWLELFFWSVLREFCAGVSASVGLKSFQVASIPEGLQSMSTQLVCAVMACLEYKHDDSWPPTPPQKSSAHFLFALVHVLFLPCVKILFSSPSCS